MKSCPTCHRTYPDDTLAFCLADGALLSAPYDPDQTQRIPAPRPTSPPATQMLSEKARPPLQSTIHGPAPQAPSLHPSVPEAVGVDIHRRSITPWLLISAAILIVGIFGVWMIASKLSTSETTTRNQSSPTPQSSVIGSLGKMCGQAVSPGMYKKWIDLGGESGKLGCPITQEAAAPSSPYDTYGRWIQFSKGDGGYLIQFTDPPKEAPNPKPVPLIGHVFEVSGCMYKLYASLGGTKSWLGFPTSDGQETDTGARQDFEDGYIVWDRKTYACNAIRNQNR